jgi:hypothetical protein
LHQIKALDLAKESSTKGRRPASSLGEEVILFGAAPLAAGDLRKSYATRGEIDSLGDVASGARAWLAGLEVYVDERLSPLVQTPAMS